MSKNIEINYKSDVDYEVLYPNTTLNSVIDWQESLYSKDEILDSATKALYGLGEGSVPKDVFELLKNRGADVRMEVGEYTGTGLAGSAYPNILHFSFTPQFVAVLRKDEVPKSNNDYSANWTHRLFLIYGVKGGCSSSDTSTNDSAYQIKVDWVENSVRYYNRSEDQTFQLNVSNAQYAYIGFGFTEFPGIYLENSYVVEGTNVAWSFSIPDGLVPLEDGTVNVIVTMERAVGGISWTSNRYVTYTVEGAEGSGKSGAMVRMADSDPAPTFTVPVTNATSNRVVIRIERVSMTT